MNIYFSFEVEGKNWVDVDWYIGKPSRKKIWEAVSLIEDERFIPKDEVVEWDIEKWKELGNKWVV